jgi:hypothetical protein
MNATDALAVIAAALVSILATAVVVKPGWSAAAKRGVALILALVLGTVAAIISGQITGIPEPAVALVQKIVISAAAVVAAAQGFHRQLAGALGSLSAATSPTVAPAPDAATDPGLPEDDPLADPGLPEETEPDYTPEHAEEPSVIPDGVGVATNQH